MCYIYVSNSNLRSYYNIMPIQPIKIYLCTKLFYQEKEQKFCIIRVTTVN